jgi:hypothetical protein
MRFYRESRSEGSPRNQNGGVVPSTRPPENAPSDQDFVATFRHLTHIEVNGQTHQVRYSDEGQAYVPLSGVFRAVDDDGT